MTYDKAPRPVPSTAALERARALLGAARRRQELFGQALFHAEGAAETPHPIDAHAHESVGANQSSFDRMVTHITNGSDQDLVGTHQKLTHAREQALRQMADDAVLASINAFAYGTPGKHPPTDVVDVLAREAAPPQALPELPGDTAL